MRAQSTRQYSTTSKLRTIITNGSCTDQNRRPKICICVVDQIYNLSINYNSQVDRKTKKNCPLVLCEIYVSLLLVIGYEAMIHL